MDKKSNLLSSLKRQVLALKSQPAPPSAQGIPTSCPPSSRCSPRQSGGSGFETASVSASLVDC